MISRTHLEYGDQGFVADQREFFDKLITQDWPTYNDPGWDRLRQLEVRQLLPRVPRCKTILDVGCGCGFRDRLLAGPPSVDRVVGIDYSPKSVQQANTHYPHPKVRRYLGDIFQHEEIVSRHGKFDLVVSFQVIEHLTNPQDFLDACSKCAVDEGFVAVVTPNKGRLQNRVLAWRGRPTELWDPLHFAEYHLQDLRALGRKAGLRYAGSFTHTLSFRLSYRVRLRALTPWGLQLGRVFPRCADVIGVVFKKDRAAGRGR